MRFRNTKNVAKKKFSSWRLFNHSKCKHLGRRNIKMKKKWRGEKKNTEENQYFFLLATEPEMLTKA